MGIKVDIYTYAFSFFPQKSFPFAFAIIKAKPNYEKKIEEI